MEKTLAPRKTSSPPVTECPQSSFWFARHFRRQVSAQFDGGMISSDGGAVLLQELDRRINLLPRLAACFEERRNPNLIEHQVSELLAQRVCALALGYEDLNDYDELRRDPLLALLAGKRDLKGSQRKQQRDRGQPLAGKSTLNRLERTTDGADRYKKIRCDGEATGRLLVDVFVEAHGEAPEQIVLDIDATDTPLHGQQEGRFFHGYYGHYCYLPLYIFSGQHVLCARQRVANQDAAAGSLDELKRIVEQIRKAWPKVKIVLRADSGFGQGEPALRGDVAGCVELADPAAVRRSLLRARRGGEPYQGTVEFIRRPHEHRYAAGQPTAAVLVGADVCVDGGTEAAGIEGDELGAGADRDDPAGVAEDRNAGEGEREAGVPVAVERLWV